ARQGAGAARGRPQGSNRPYGLDPASRQGRPAGDAARRGAGDAGGRGSTAGSAANGGGGGSEGGERTRELSSPALAWTSSCRAVPDRTIARAAGRCGATQADR